MKFLLVQLITLITSVIFLIYLLTLEHFVPYISGSTLNGYNVSTVLLLTFALVQSIVSLVIFLSQKFIAFSWKEFPTHTIALKWGLIIAVSVVGGFLLNIFDILIFPWGGIALLLVIILLTVI
ncbi:hypothetical protein HYV12_01850 [Candidatus Dojkabacteria bacterium]|nr:hypothetical protein [Candidatus Dojkabacteria bacterium]